MKRLIAATAALLLALAALASTGAFAGAAATADPAQRNGHARLRALPATVRGRQLRVRQRRPDFAIERANVVYAGQTERRQQDSPRADDDLPLREGRLEDRPPARGHDGRSAASDLAADRSGQPLSCGARGAG